MSQSFIKKPDNGPHSALAGLGVLRSEQPAAHAPTRKPLTEEQIILATEHISMEVPGCFIRIARAIEAAHGIGVSGGQHQTFPHQPPMPKKAEP